MSGEKVLVLSGKHSNALLSKHLKDMGHYVVLVDKYESSFAAPYADECICENPFDYSAIKKIVEDIHPDRIATIGIERTFKIASRLSDEYGLKFPYSYSDVLNFTEKDRMKSIFKANGILSAHHVIVNDPLEPIDHFSFPIIVKPVDSCGSQGVVKVEAPKEYDQAIQYALSKSNLGAAVVEEFIDGDEFQADCFVQNGKTQVIMVKQKLKFEDGVVSSQLGSLTSPVHSTDGYKLYEDVACQIAKAFGIKNGIFFFQAIKHASSLYVIEIGVRLGGGWSYKMINMITGFDYPGAATNALMGIETAMDNEMPGKYYMTNFLFPEKCVFDHVEGLEELKNDNVIDDYEVLKQKGREIDGSVSNPNRTAIYMMSAGSYDELLDKMEDAVNRIDIIDVAGESHFSRDIYRNFISKMRQQ